MPSLPAGTEQSTSTHMPEGPDSRDDTHDLIDDALAELARRRGGWLGDDIAAMTLIGQAERFLPEMVTNARSTAIPGRDQH